MKKALIHSSLLLLRLISLVAIQRLTFLLFTVSDVITLIFSITLNSTCDDSVNTNTGLKCTSIDLLQLRTLRNNVINATNATLAVENPNFELCTMLVIFDHNLYIATKIKASVTTITASSSLFYGDW